MKVGLTLKKFPDSEYEFVTVDLPETGGFVKVVDGIHVRLIVEPKPPTACDTGHCGHFECHHGGDGR